MAERTTIRLPEELMRRAKRKAAAQGRSLTDLIEDGVRRVLTDPQLAAELRRKGLVRARDFSWERSVARTHEIYRLVGELN